MKGREGYGVRERVNERKSEIEKRKKERKKTKKNARGRKYHSNLFVHLQWIESKQKKLLY